MSLGYARTSLKILFIGDPKVGISSFLTVLRGKPFPNLYIPPHADIVGLHAMVPHRSPAEDSKSWEDWSDQPEFTTDCDTPTTKSTIQLLDITTYGERFRWSKEAAYRGANAVVLCFSVARRESFETLKTKWLPHIIRSLPGVPVLLVGMKSDLRLILLLKSAIALPEERRHLPPVVRYEEGVAVAKEFGARTYMECSAKTSAESVQEVQKMAVWLALHHSEH